MCEGALDSECCYAVAERAISFFLQIPAFVSIRGDTSVLYLILKSLVLLCGESLESMVSIMQVRGIRILSKIVKIQL